MCTGDHVAPPDGDMASARPHVLQLWLARGSGNANFLFGTNMAWGATLVLGGQGW